MLYLGLLVELLLGDQVGSALQDHLQPRLPLPLVQLGLAAHEFLHGGALDGVQRPLEQLYNCNNI